MTRRKYLFYFILFLTACGGGDGVSNLGSQQNVAPKLIGLTDYAIDENTSIVTTIKATDPDGDIITYSLTGIDSSLLSINPSSGLLTFQSPPDYENPQDDNQDNIYSITVTASDGQLSASLEITISVAFSGPTLDEPFHMPTMTDTSTLDVVVVEGWHVDTINLSLIHISEPTRPY